MTEPPVVLLREITDLPEESRGVYESLRAARGGTLPNVYKAMSAAPDIASLVSSLGMGLRHQSSLPRELQELVILVVAHHCRNPYVWTHHSNAAERFGIDQATVVRAISGLDVGRDVLDAVLSYARCILNGEECPHSLLEDLKRAFGEQGLVELTVLVGFYVLICRFNTAMRVPLESGAKLRAFLEPLGAD